MTTNSELDVEIGEEEVVEALHRILASEELRSSPQLQSVLRFIIEQELAGRGDQIKAYSIAVDVLARPPTFDPQTDSTVRVIAGRLRRSLETYYESEGRDDALRIEVPKGGYRPLFHRQSRSQQLPMDEAHKEKAASPAASLWHVRSRLFQGIVVVALLLLAHHFWISPADERQGVQEEASPRPPIIGVTLFPNLSNDSTLDRFAYGLRFDLVSELTTFSWLSVFLENEVKAVDSRIGNPRYPPDGPHVDYVLSGAVYFDNDWIIISYQLSETDTQLVRWAETYKQQLSADSIFGIQRDAAMDISVEIGRPEGVVAKLEERRFRSVPSDLNAYLCVLRLYDYWRSFSAEDHLELRQCLEQAIDVEPGYAEAYAALAFIYLDEWRYEINRREGYDPVERGLDMAEEAARLDPFSTLAKRALSSANLALGNVDAFKRFSRQALEQAPNNPELLADFGNKLAITAGEWEEGARFLHRALGLNPDPAPWYFLAPAFRGILTADYEDALRWTKRMNTPDWFVYQMIRAIAFSASGDAQATRDSLVALREFAIDDEDDGRERMREFNLHSSLRRSLIDGLEGAYRLAAKLVN